MKIEFFPKRRGGGWGYSLNNYKLFQGQKDNEAYNEDNCSERQWGLFLVEQNETVMFFPIFTLDIFLYF